MKMLTIGLLLVALMQLSHPLSFQPPASLLNNGETPILEVRTPRPLRIWAISDLHAQSARSRTIIEEWHPHGHSNESALGEDDAYYYDVLLVAGDIASGLSQIEDCLRKLTGAYDEVVMCVGNHELWVGPEGDSISKMKAVHDLAAACGVRTGPVRYKSPTRWRKVAAAAAAAASVSKMSKPTRKWLMQWRGYSSDIKQQKRCSEATRSLVREVQFEGDDSPRCAASRGEGDCGDDPAGIHTVSHGALPPEDAEETEVVLFPLQSWYHASWDTEMDVDSNFALVTSSSSSSSSTSTSSTSNSSSSSEKSVRSSRPGRSDEFAIRWADFRYCRWPKELIAHDTFASLAPEDTEAAMALPRFFAKLNEHAIETFLDEQHKDSEEWGEATGRTTGKLKRSRLITFSHFVPFQELCPEKRFLIEPLLPKVIGSSPLAEQIVRLTPDLHVFGHTHIPIDLALDLQPSSSSASSASPSSLSLRPPVTASRRQTSTRFLQWPLGSSRERSRQCRAIAEHGPLLVFDATAATVAAAKEVVAFSPDAAEEEPVRLQAPVRTFWGEHYAKEKRDPSVIDPAPWVVQYYRSKNEVRGKFKLGGRL